MCKRPLEEIKGPCKDVGVAIEDSTGRLLMAREINSLLKERTLLRAALSDMVDVHGSECGVGIHAGTDDEHDSRCPECRSYLLARHALDFDIRKEKPNARTGR